MALFDENINEHIRGLAVPAQLSAKFLDAGWIQYQRGSRKDDAEITLQLNLETHGMQQLNN